MALRGQGARPSSPEWGAAFGDKPKPQLVLDDGLSRGLLAAADLRGLPGSMVAQRRPPRPLERGAAVADGSSSGMLAAATDISGTSEAAVALHCKRPRPSEVGEAWAKQRVMRPVAAKQDMATPLRVLASVERRRTPQVSNAAPGLEIGSACADQHLAEELPAECAERRCAVPMSCLAPGTSIQVGQHGDIPLLVASDRRTLSFQPLSARFGAGAHLCSARAPSLPHRSRAPAPSQVGRGPGAFVLADNKCSRAPPPRPSHRGIVASQPLSARIGAAFELRGRRQGNSESIEGHGVKDGADPIDDHGAATESVHRQTTPQLNRGALTLSARMAGTLVERSCPSDAPALGAFMLLGPDEPSLHLEPGIAAHLLPHQQEGVRFMYRHLYAGSGCILADFMGLGKSLQALCVIWAALSRPAGQPLCQRACIVCPASLCAHWEAECEKWLGPLRLRPAVVHSGPASACAIESLQNFRCSGRLLIISYDQLRLHADIIDEDIGLLVCDEGHRLKSTYAATARRLDAMHCRRRILLTGTPLQNCLEEFWQCVKFVQPGLLPPLSDFQLHFRPIDRAQDASASLVEVRLGAEVAAELLHLTREVILRRGPELLEALLPLRTELLLTVPLKPPQVHAYRALCATRFASPQQGRHRGDCLALIATLRQLCNVDPSNLLGRYDKKLGCTQELFEDDDQDETIDESAPHAGFLMLCRQAIASACSSGMAVATTSGKLALLEALLRWLQTYAPDDGIVIMSGFLNSLAHCRALCHRLGIPVDQIVGATPAQARVETVSTFNRRHGCRVLLVSTKAGGVGLNIVGASRLVMLEPDWNPAVDMQAMGRVWRQGQRKAVFVYRLASHGTIEENMLRRQARKQAIANAALDNGRESQGSGAPLGLSDMAELRKVYQLDGYDGLGNLIERSSLDDGGRSETSIPQEAGLGDSAIRAALSSMRILGTSIGAVA